MRNLGIKGIHVAERDTQITDKVRPLNEFWNTWSIEGFISEGIQQPSECGWGIHEKWMPRDASTFDFGSKSAIYMDRPGVNVNIKSWCPTGPQSGMLISHA